jgi:hypothetical protein
MNKYTIMHFSLGHMFHFYPMSKFFYWILYFSDCDKYPMLIFTLCLSSYNQAWYLIDSMVSYFHSIIGFHVKMGNDGQ